MRQIVKGEEPDELTSWKKTNPRGRYPDLDPTTRQAIRRAAIKEQFGLCAYCCKKVTLDKSTSEHVISQKSDQNQSLNFFNIIASCDKKDRCNQARGSKTLRLTPLMAECETELKFDLKGSVEGKTERATEIIKILGLDTRAIRNERKILLDYLIFQENNSPEELELLDDKTLNSLIGELKNPDEKGELQPYSPALINIIRGILKNTQCIMDAQSPCRI